MIFSLGVVGESAVLVPISELSKSASVRDFVSAHKPVKSFEQQGGDEQPAPQFLIAPEIEFVSNLDRI